VGGRTEILALEHIILDCHAEGGCESIGYFIRFLSDEDLMGE
jgi:hypothetical protein